MTVVPIETRSTLRHTAPQFKYFNSIHEFGITDEARNVRIEGALTKDGARTLRDELDKYIGDKPKPVTVDSITAELRLDTARFRLELEKANAARLLKSTLDGLAKPIKPAVPSWDVRSGDKVKLHGRDALVTNVKRHYDYDSGFKRGETVTIDLALLAPPVPPKPPVPVVKVGDVINGDTLRAVQWKRGTVVTAIADLDSQYALKPDGTWYSLTYDSLVTFSDFGLHGRFRVDYAPGK